MVGTHRPATARLPPTTDTTATPPATAYTAETKAYAPSPARTCADETSVLQIEGVILGLELGQGEVSGAKGCVDDAADGTRRLRASAASCRSTSASPACRCKTGDGGSVSGTVGWAPGRQDRA